MFEDTYRFLRELFGRNRNDSCTGRTAQSELTPTVMTEAIALPVSPAADPGAACGPPLPVTPRTRIWIRILIFFFTCVAMVALVKVGLEVAAAALALVYSGVIAVQIADRIMSGPSRGRRAP